MAKKHNNWMKILTAVFTALANLFGSLKIKGSASDADSEATDGAGAPAENSAE